MTESSTSTNAMTRANKDSLVRALDKIRNAWIVATVTAALTLALILYSVLTGNTFGVEMGLWELIDVALGFALAFGIYRKIRTCSTLMLMHFVSSKIYLYQVSGRIPGMLSLVVSYFLIQGIVGTFAYHKAMNQTKNVPGNGS